MKTTPLARLAARHICFAGLVAITGCTLSDTQADEPIDDYESALDPSADCSTDDCSDKGEEADDGCPDHSGTGWVASSLPDWFKGICMGARQQAIGNTPRCASGCRQTALLSYHTGSQFHYGNDAHVSWWQGSHYYCEGFASRTCEPIDEDDDSADEEFADEEFAD